MTEIDLGESGFSIDKHVAAIAHTCISSVADKNKSTLGIKAREHYALMMVCCYCWFFIVLYILVIYIANKHGYDICFLSQALPFAMQNLIEPEMEEIKALIQKHPEVAAPTNTHPSSLLAKFVSLTGVKIYEQSLSD